MGRELVIDGTDGRPWRDALTDALRNCDEYKECDVLLDVWRDLTEIERANGTAQLNDLFPTDGTFPITEPCS